MSVYDNDSVTREFTLNIIEKYGGIFHIYRLSDDDINHVEELLWLMQIPLNAKVLDSGCGVGCVAQLMMKIRPDLEITLLNVSKAQLDLCPLDFSLIHSSFEKTPCLDETFDVVMFLYSIGHGELSVILKEANRILKKRGIVFIYDLIQDKDNSLDATLGYKTHKKESFEERAIEAGFSINHSEKMTNFSFRRFREMIGDDFFLSTLKDISPFSMRLIKD